MSTQVIILAQGDQKRIPDLRTPKQLLPLPACGGVAILNRTLRQVYHHAPFSHGGDRTSTCTVVGWPTIADHFEVAPVELKDARVRPYVHTLAEPGNSSLRGLARYWGWDTFHIIPNAARTVVLLGDVVYSWNVMWELFCAPRDAVFAVSSDISLSDGELWGIAWDQVANTDMTAAFKHALLAHSAHDAVYQPGQMRLWLWEYERRLRGIAARYVTDSTEGDYTADIDLPRHTTPAFLGPLSAHAAEDDAGHGVSW